MPSRYPKNVNIYLMLKGNRGKIPTADIMVDKLDECLDRWGIEGDEREYLGDLLFRIQETAQIVQGLGAQIMMDMDSTNIDSFPESMQKAVVVYNDWTADLNTVTIRND